MQNSRCKLQNLKDLFRCLVFFILHFALRFCAFLQSAKLEVCDPAALKEEAHMKEYKAACQTAFFFAAILITFLFTMVSPVGAEKAEDAQSLVDRALVAFNGFMRDPNYTWLHTRLDDARGVLIFPQVLRGGFILGGSGGSGVFLIKQAGGGWSDPAFYTIGSVSLGLQIGAQAAEVVMLAMTQRAVDSLLTSSLKLGGDVSIAAGPYGRGAARDVTADFVSFSKAKGAYAGLNLEGSVVKVRNSLNAAYYGRGAGPVDILVRQGVTNPGADQLQIALSQATGAGPAIPQGEVPQGRLQPNQAPRSEVPQGQRE